MEVRRISKTKAKKPSKRRVLLDWHVARDDLGDGGQSYYVLLPGPGVSRKDENSGYWENGNRFVQTEMPPKDYEAGTPKSLHLKPGDGPIKVKLVEA